MKHHVITAMLVKETRFFTVKKGPNKLQFSWANTLIDPSSVESRPLGHADEIEVADTVFPGQKPQHLIWNIVSKFEGQVKVEVTYFTSGLTWSMDYVSIVDPPEKHMHLRGYVRVYNRWGEEYEDAEIRLIVGTINLVEKIADMARRRTEAQGGGAHAVADGDRSGPPSHARLPGDGLEAGPGVDGCQALRDPHQRAEPPGASDRSLELRLLASQAARPRS